MQKVCTKLSSMSPSRSPFVFIVRIWHEPREIENAEEKWRCMVENITTHETNYFLSPEMLADYIKRSTGFIKFKSDAN
jgi:hypothetical protein